MPAEPWFLPMLIILGVIGFIIFILMMADEDKWIQERYERRRRDISRCVACSKRRCLCKKCANMGYGCHSADTCTATIHCGNGATYIVLERSQDDWSSFLY